MEDKELSLKKLLPLFLLSGAAGLMYELSWIRECSLIFGSTLPAVTTVTAIFFGGMALGSALLSRKGTKYSGKLYGIIQLGIALSSLLSIPLFQLFSSVTVNLFPSLSEVSFLYTLYRFVAVAITIGVPTFLMGATFPVMMAVSPVKEGREGYVAGLINGINSLGAVGGTIITAFLLMPLIGMNGTIILAALLNVFVALPFLLAKITVKEHSETEHSPVTLFPALPLFFSIGFAGMASQILWSRFLTLVIHNTVYTYAITISVVIAGLSIGSIAAGIISSKVKEFSRALGTIAILHVTAFLAALLLPSTVWLGIGLIENELIRIGLISVIMFIPALFAGASFPIALKMIGGGRDVRGRTAGLLSAVNTVGGILGSLFGGFLLIPYLGIGGTIFTIAVILVAVGLTAFLATKKVGLYWLVLILPVGVAVSLYKSPKQFIYSYLISPKGKNVHFDTKTNKLVDLHEKVVFLEEGKLSSVTVKSKGDNFKTMEIDRLWQGENRKTRQIMAAHLPMLLADSVKNVAVIGVGPGITAKRFTQYEIDSLDLVDIESAVFDAAKKHFDGSWMDGEGIRTLVSDGLNFVRYGEKKYDLISVEIGQVFRPHAAGFYSEEFYEDVQRRLTENGVVGQFVPVASFQKESFKRVIATFLSVFPTSQLWYNRSEFLLIGFNGKEGTMGSPTVNKWLTDGTAVFEDLDYSYWGGSRYSLNKINNLAGGFLLGSSDLKRLTEGADVYSDRIPELEYTAARNLNNKPFIDELRPFLTPVDSIVTGLSRKERRYVEQVRLANLDNVVAEELLIRYLQLGNPALVEKAFELNPANIRANRYLGSIAYEKGDFTRAEKHLFSVYKQDFESRGAGRQVALMRMQLGDLNGAVELLVDILQRDDKDAATHALLGAALLQKQKFEMGKQHTVWALELDPSSAIAMKNMEYLKSIGMVE